MRRATDSEDRHWFRSDRFFTSDGAWFFTTRENANFGPFTRFPDAQQSLRRYLETQRSVQRVRGHVPALDPDDTFDANSVAALAEHIQGSKHSPKN